MSEVTEAVAAEIDADFARDLERFAARDPPEVVITNATGAVLAMGHDAVA